MNYLEIKDLKVIFGSFEDSKHIISDLQEIESEILTQRQSNKNRNKKPKRKYSFES